MNEQVADFIKNHCPISKAMGIEAIDFGEKTAKALMRLDERQKNHYGMAHGGALFTLADIAAGILATHLGYITVTLNSNMTFYKPGVTPIIYAESKIKNDSGKIASIDVRITDPEGTLLAECSFLLYKKNPEHFKTAINNLGFLAK